MCPVYGGKKRTNKGNLEQVIKSFRVWVNWADGDWTAETQSSFTGEHAVMIKRMLQGSEVYPWPSSNSPTDTWKRKKLKSMNMTEWKDKAGKRDWINIPMSERNSEDKLEDLPDDPKFDDPCFSRNVCPSPTHAETTTEDDSDIESEDDEV